MRKAITALAAVLILAGCAVGPDYQAPEMDLPEAWPESSLLADGERAAWVDWWKRFDDPTLNQLVERAVANNLDIRLQAARLEEARARLGMASAEQLPTVDLQAEAARERGPATLQPAFPGVEPRARTDNLFSVSGVLGYEIDLFGRLAREREAAEAFLLENVFSQDAVRLNLIADVVTTYFDLRAAQQQLAITENTLVSREETYALERVRYEAGETDELTLRQAEAELQSTRAEIPLRQEQVSTLEGVLGVLVGMSPAELMTLDEMDLGEYTPLEAIHLPEDLPATLPSELLERRPDVRAAEAELMAATAAIGVAQAERLPRLNLTALLGTAATDTSDLFTGAAETWGLGSSVAGPLFDFGRGRAGVEAAEAMAAQSRARYQATVISAFNEVRDALSLYRTSSQRAQAIRAQVAAVERTSQLAELRYQEGFIGFIEVLDAQRSLLAAELALAEAVRDQLNATATLFKALGGGWAQPDPPADDARDEPG
ncbi:efflux transporter outer membrane subunit [Alkalilimnicola ehrlichii MLHE-1]|uniref:RND efflux system, outer membrane lipoprotein, NodT family n=1 Tax=Alkalilimnicola ehrlichii (strain ATCC BAA-1101 / DSM 17681 / MLHE-1) TaxID=187272 RepID=Q0A8T1_ALKEH|nr:efflux transporter outer membrane subunit [Alkalilimnicola ehrlichii]ABI56756.1 RND efflux system, outer membrane lipoprotein, NodT family [Alkalilimnicola ehrlichii MLHE-1]